MFLPSYPRTPEYDVNVPYVVPRDFAEVKLRQFPSHLGVLHIPSSYPGPRANVWTHLSLNSCLFRFLLFNAARRLLLTRKGSPLIAFSFL